MNSIAAGLMVTPNIRLVRHLGAGGMGSVWIAEHLALHTQVVVKFISEEMGRNEEAVVRFAREAAAASQVRSPHVVQTFDHGVTHGGLPYIVMELLEGEDLASYIDRAGAIEAPLLCEIITQLGRALEKAHGVGIIHRDIKPSNIFLCDAGDGAVFVKLLDFGIAKLGPTGKLSGDTKTGAMMGSPLYMSPEQLIGSRDIDARADLWAVGVVTYEALTGTRPYDATTIGGLTVKIFNEVPPAPSHAASIKGYVLPVALDAWFARACAVNLPERFATIRELVESLQSALISARAPWQALPLVGAAASSSGSDIPLARSLTTTETGATVFATHPLRRLHTAWVIGGLAALVIAILGAYTLRAPRSSDAANPSVGTFASVTPTATNAWIQTPSAQATAAHSADPLVLAEMAQTAATIRTAAPTAAKNGKLPVSTAVAPSGRPSATPVAPIGTHETIL